MAKLGQIDTEFWSLFLSQITRLFLHIAIHSTELILPLRKIILQDFLKSFYLSSVLYTYTPFKNAQWVIKNYLDWQLDHKTTAKWSLMWLQAQSASKLGQDAYPCTTLIWLAKQKNSDSLWFKKPESQISEYQVLY